MLYLSQHSCGENVSELNRWGDEFLRVLKTKRGDEHEYPSSATTAAVRDHYAIDITFFMLIFFMLFTTFHSQQTGMDVKLPQAETGEATAVEDFIISVDADRQLYWQGQPIALAELESMIKMQLQENPPKQIHCAGGSDNSI